MLCALYVYLLAILPALSHSLIRCAAQDYAEVIRITRPVYDAFYREELEEQKRKLYDLTRLRGVEIDLPTTTYDKSFASRYHLAAYSPILCHLFSSVFLLRPLPLDSGLLGSSLQVQNDNQNKRNNQEESRGETKDDRKKNEARRAERRKKEDEQ